MTLGKLIIVNLLYLNLAMLVALVPESDPDVWPRNPDFIYVNNMAPA
jgi:hypothetical protein